MATFWECFFDNNPDSLTDLADVVAPLVLSLISGGQVVEVPATVDASTYTLSTTPNPINSLVLLLISGGVSTEQILGVDYTINPIVPFTILMTVPLVGGESLVAIFYDL